MHEIEKDGIIISDLYAAFLPEHQIAIVSDLHIGYEGVLQREGVMIPKYQKKILMERIEKIIERFKPRLLIINGDFKHEFGKNVTIRGNVVIGEDTIIHSGSYIEGPVIIGKGCEIGPNTCIFPSTSIGNNVTIHPFSCIRNSVVMDNSTIGPYSLLSNSVVGKGCEIASRFSAIEGETKVEVENEIHEIKAGSFIGNDCKIGANVIVEAGKIIGGKCTISPNKVVNRDVPDGSMVI